MDTSSAWQDELVVGSRNKKVRLVGPSELLHAGSLVDQFAMGFVGSEACVLLLGAWHAPTSHVGTTASHIHLHIAYVDS